MSISGNLNYIKRAMRHPCALPSPEIVIETAVEAAAVMFMKLSLFGCTDIIKMKAGRSPWHTRAMRGLIEGSASPQARAGNRWMWATPYNQIEQALWYWLVAEAVTGFIPDWASLIYQEQRCSQPGSGYIGCPLTALYISGGSTGQVLINDAEDKQCVRVGGNQVSVKAGCEGGISYFMEWIPFNNDPANAGSVTTWIERNDGIRIQEDTSTPTGFQGRMMTSAMLQDRATILADETYKIFYRVNQGLMGCQNGRLSVSGYGRHMPLLGAGCSPKSVAMPYPTG
jgi:hypothetical protein